MKKHNYLLAFIMVIVCFMAMPLKSKAFEIIFEGSVSYDTGAGPESVTAGDENGGGVYIFNSFPIITNSILWENLPEEISTNPFDLYLSEMSLPFFRTWPLITYSDVKCAYPWMRYPGMGNINKAPLFIDSEAGDYRLQPGSPCIKRRRFRNDIGAYEYDGTPWR